MTEEATTVHTGRTPISSKLVLISLSLCLIIFDVVYYYRHHHLTSSDGTDKNFNVIHPHDIPRRKLLGNKKEEKDAVKSNNNGVVDFDSSDPHLSLFSLSEYTVLGPTQFPKPTHVIQTDLQAQLVGEDIKGVRVEVEPILKPVLGKHRPDQDAVFVFASEYDLGIYQGFILSLRKTGFQGDIVLAVSPLDMAAPGAKPTPRQQSLLEFFSSDPNVIIYVVPFVCYNAEGQMVDSSKGGMRVCECNVLYGSRNVTEAKKKGDKDTMTDWQPLNDWRIARPVATTRYELYWLWAIHYNKHSWLMLIDARDTYFQTDPFAQVPREPDLDRDDGVIFFFGVRMTIQSNLIGVQGFGNRTWRQYTTI